MPLLAATLITLLLVILAVLLHYEALLQASRLALRLTVPARRRILVVIAAALLAHLAQIGLFAVGYLGMEQAGLGAVIGLREGGFLDFFYFSATTYTTLGVGDLAASGLVRLTTGVEALVGLVLIAWTATFTYVSLERFRGEP